MSYCVIPVVVYATFILFAPKTDRLFESNKQRVCKNLGINADWGPQFDQSQRAALYNNNNNYH